MYPPSAADWEHHCSDTGSIDLHAIIGISLFCFRYIQTHFKAVRAGDRQKIIKLLLSGCTGKRIYHTVYEI